jgi:hypothetical protein
MPKPLSISWSESVTESESAVITEAVQFALSWLTLRYMGAVEIEPVPVRVFGYWLVPALVPDQPYWGVQWYVDTSYDATLKQIIAPTLLDLIRREPWQRAEPHFDLMVLDRDLTEFPAPLARLRPDEYAFGTSLPGTGAVISLDRLRRQISPGEMQDLALRRLVLHHLGHILGVPHPRRKADVSRRGLELHCSHWCVMRHAETLEDLTDLTVSEWNLDWPFCEVCTRDLLSVIVEHSREWN